jgi:hypothetical protein
MSCATILTDLYNVTLTSITGLTKEQRFRVVDEEFAEFTKFPLYVVETGDEEDAPQSNRVSKISFHPAVHYFAEDDTLANMETARETIRNAIMNDTTLRADSFTVHIDKITVSMTENRKQQHLRFDLTIEFEIVHT